VKEDVVAAFKGPKFEILGQTVSVKRCIPSVAWTNFDSTQDGCKIYASNLDASIDKPALRAAFSKVFALLYFFRFFIECKQFGKIREIRLVPKTSISFAYIEFDVARSAERALELDGKTLDGFPSKKISVAISNPSLRK
jgi:hypothetical protein